MQKSLWLMQNTCLHLFILGMSFFRTSFIPVASYTFIDAYGRFFFSVAICVHSFCLSNWEMGAVLPPWDF